MDRFAKRWTEFGASTHIESPYRKQLQAQGRARRRCAARRFAWRRWTVTEHRDSLGGNQPLLADHPRQGGDRLDRPDLPPLLLDLYGRCGQGGGNALSQAEAALAEFRSEAERHVREAAALEEEAFERLREARVEVDSTRQRATAQSEAREAIATICYRIQWSDLGTSGPTRDGTDKATACLRCARRDYITAVIRETNFRELRERKRAVFLGLFPYV